jgi:site-specific recombinase XerD
MKQNISDIVNSILQELEARGLTQSTLSLYRHGLFEPIIHYFIENSDGKYDQEILSAYLTKYQNALKCGDITRDHYTRVKRVLHYITSHAETGVVSFTDIRQTKKFVPSANSQAIIKNALSNTELKNEYKYKLDSILRKFFCYTEGKGLNVANITVDDIRGFINHVRTSNAGSMGYVTHALNVLLTYLRAESMAQLEFDSHYLTPKASPKKVIEAFTKQEIASMLSCISTSTSLGKRDKAIILLACGTGLRGIDIVNLELSDINWKDGKIAIVQSKTNHPMIMPVNGQILNAIADYILNGRHRSDSQIIFLCDRAPHTALRTTVLDATISRLSVKAGVVKKHYRSFHSLRRSFGTWMANEQIPITTIAQLLGHKDLNSSKPYLSFNDKQMLNCALGFADIPLKGGVYA